MLGNTIPTDPSVSARWYSQAKLDAHRRVRRAVRQALKGYPPRAFTLTVKEGKLLRAL